MLCEDWPLRNRLAVNPPRVAQCTVAAPGQPQVSAAGTFHIRAGSARPNRPGGRYDPCTIHLFHLDVDACIFRIPPRQASALT